MRIGIDTDGVLTDMYAYNYMSGRKYFKREPTDPAGYDIKEMFGVGEKEELRYGLKYFFYYCRLWPPRDGATETFARLSRDGHALYGITARKFVTKKNLLGAYSRYLLKKWYRRHRLGFAGIAFCSEENAASEKLAGCRRFRVDLMVEDRPNVARHLAGNGIPVLLFDAPYNQDTQGENITRVYSWDEVYDILLRKSQKNEHKKQEKRRCHE